MERSVRLVRPEAPGAAPPGWRAEVLDAEGRVVGEATVRPLAGEPDAERLALIERAARAAAECRALAPARAVLRGEAGWAVALPVVEGVTAEALLAAGPLPPRAVAEIGAAVAGALAAAQAVDPELVHGALGPDRVAVGAAGVRLLDLGTGSAPDAFVAPQYRPPEGDGAGAPGDVYALGALLVELRTGVAVFPDADPERHARGVDEVLADVAEEPLRAWLRRMLAHAPADRPEAAEVAAALADAAPGLDGPGAAGHARSVEARGDDPSAGALRAGMVLEVVRELDGGALAEEAPAGGEPGGGAGDEEPDDDEPTEPPEGPVVERTDDDPTGVTELAPEVRRPRRVVIEYRPGRSRAAPLDPSEWEEEEATVHADPEEVRRVLERMRRQRAEAEARPAERGSGERGGDAGEGAEGHAPGEAGHGGDTRDEGGGDAAAGTGDAEDREDEARGGDDAEAAPGAADEDDRDAAGDATGDEGVEARGAVSEHRPRPLAMPWIALVLVAVFAAVAWWLRDHWLAP